MYDRNISMFSSSLDRLISSLLFIHSCHFSSLFLFHQLVSSFSLNSLPWYRYALTITHTHIHCHKHSNLHTCIWNPPRIHMDSYHHHHVSFCVFLLLFHFLLLPLLLLLPLPLSSSPSSSSFSFIFSFL